MKQTGWRGFGGVVKSVQKTYGFLFEKGYEVISAGGYDMGWQVVLRKQDLDARIIRSRGEESISFRAGSQSPDEFVDIGSLIYAATGDKVPPWQSSEPKMIERYLGRIETYLKGEYVRNRDGLRIAQDEYYAGFQPSEVPAPPEPVPPEPDQPEPKVIPILYYPLMGIIILLIFGALATLYLAVLDRLFAAFSLDPESYRIFMGVLALILALGTMVLFRRRKTKR